MFCTSIESPIAISGAVESLGIVLVVSADVFTMWQVFASEAKKVYAVEVELLTIVEPFFHGPQTEAVFVLYFTIRSVPKAIAICDAETTSAFEFMCHPNHECVVSGAPTEVP